MKITYPLKNIHTISEIDILQSLQTNADVGLSTTEAANRTKQYGLNVYQAQKQKSIWLMILHQFASPIVYLLLVGAGVSVYFKDYTEAVAILIVIIVNALIGFLMELHTLYFAKQTGTTGGEIRHPEIRENVEVDLTIPKSNENND
jgi:P-type Ca2+ transporter type 2C